MTSMNATSSFSGHHNSGLQIGSNSGQVYFYQSTQSETPQQKPSPSSTVPFRRDPDFVDRGILNGRTALVGLGGVGKSQLAIEYAYQVQTKDPSVWVFWVYGGSDALFEQGYRTIADRVKIPRWDEAGANVVDLVNAWLSNEVNGRWLMVLDNVDHLRRPTTEVGDSTLEAGPMSSIPQTQNGSVLVTSRNKDAAFRLVGSHPDIINVEPMDESHALQLLRKKIVGDIDEGNAIQLVQALDYMPLAISQAGAFISHRAPRMDIPQYLEIFNESDLHQASLLDRDMGDMRRDHSEEKSIFKTWKILFEHIREQRASAARLLSLMCLFDRQGIPDTLLRDRYRSPVNVDTDLPANGDLGFEEDISTLRSYSLIRTANEKDTSFEMHRLVQSSTRWWLRSSGHLERWQAKYIRMMAEVFPSGEYETWTTCQALFPHAKVVLEYQPADSEHLKPWTRVLFRAGHYALEMGYYSTAEEMGRRALEVTEKVRGEKHPDTLRSVHQLALALLEQRRYQDAEEMGRRALEGREKALGEKHKDTLKSVNVLGSILHQQGKLEVAEMMLRRLLEEGEKTLGKEHLDTLTSANNLARVLQDQGKLEAAEEMLQRVIKGSEKTLGEGYSRTLLMSVYNLAYLYLQQKRYQDAEPLLQRAIRGRENALGKEHQDTLLAIHNLAYLYEKQKRYQDADTLYRRAYDGFQLTLGPDHRWTIKCWKRYSSMLEKSKASSSRTVLRSSEEPRSDEGRNTGSTVAPHPSQSS